MGISALSKKIALVSYNEISVKITISVDLKEHFREHAKETSSWQK